MFNVLLSFLPDVPSSYIDHCIAMGYVPGREKRPYGMCKIQPFCNAPFKGTFKEVSVFRKELERRFEELHCKVKRVRFVSTVNGEPMVNAPLLYLETVLTVPVKPLTVEPSELLQVIAFMRGRNGGVYQDIMCTRDDRKETWRTVIRGPANKELVDDRAELIVSDARKMLNVTDSRIQRVHLDSYPDMDTGWIK